VSPSCTQLFKDKSYIRMSIDTHDSATILLKDENSEFGQVFSDSLIPVAFNKLYLPRAARRSLTIQNAGGSSNLSEALSIYYMRNRFKGSGFVLEKEMRYWIDYKMCDFLVNIYGQRFGVSVTRAFGYPTSKNYTEQSAYNLLIKKLDGLILARHCISEEHSFTRCILHIWSDSAKVTDFLMKAYINIQKDDPTFYKTIMDVIVIITTCSERYIYTNTL
jgi:hypothetical protein